ncbi:dCTP deaminase/dUTPase family protein [Halapricum hydrolyticum]|uniref:dCTP deaminase n=1 Tax=Halapricum hydrolyticum TaxID=2979991 RepID=A0AAE3LFC4_9EURY|nr:dCTP deaminase [Halapricum hydrolyticum]MCU4718465.1 dCTP deaminase [Halapricum hydrolyticum]MCU4727516.1 dCTP deaminase [Halapricum hydrolyticum]
MDLTQFVEDIVHEPSQASGRGFDLTVAEVYEVDAPGRVDFGGGELEDAELTPHERTLRNPDDDYEWWHLNAGQYLLEYNESLTLPDDLFAKVQTREAVRERGAFHPTLSVQSLGRVPLSVGGSGLYLKENARVSTIVGIDRR